MSNRSSGVFDSGATHRESGTEFRESDIALKYRLTLREKLRERGHTVFMTRDDNEDHTPVSRRARMAEDAGCEAFVSLHLNDFEDDNANGVEVLFRDDRALAQKMQDVLVRVSGLRDRTIKQRPDLAVLNFRGPAVLVELGFIANDKDRNTLLSTSKRDAICEAIADCFPRT